KLQRRVLEEHRALQSLQRPAGLEAKLLYEHLSGFVVDPKRLGLTARPGEGDHELGAESLSQRVLRDQRLELRHQLGMAAKRKLGLDPVLRGRRAQLLQPR